MDQIKQSFNKVKQDIDLLKYQISDLKKELNEIQNTLLYLLKNQEKPIQNQENTQKNTQTHSSTLRHINSTHNQQNPTNNQTSTHSSTHNQPFQSFKPINLNISTGNEGVSTDRQTNQQTDTSTHNQQNLTNNQTQNQINKQFQQTNQFHQQFQPFQSPQQSPDPEIVLDQLDTIKKELRLKIKQLTKQEMLVLSTIYQFEDQGKTIDYSTLSQILNLSESSIRDYITRIINKKIPIIKKKVNNKRIILHISPNLRQLASLNTLISLREL